MRAIITLLFILYIAVIGSANAQVLAPRDTSFSVQSAYLKERKKHPHIQIAAPPKPAGIAAINSITYASYAGREMKLDLFYPKGKRKQKYPVVLLIHGGGWRSGNRTMEIPMAQQMAARGYVTAVVEYRLATEASYPAAVHDLKAAIRWMRSQHTTYPVDTANIALMGFSAGGQLAALLGATNLQPAFEGTANPGYSSKVQAVVNVDGTLAFIHPESQESAAAAFWLGGTAAEKPETWHEAAPLTHVDQHTAPTLFINSAIPRFHAGREDMKAKLNALGIYHETHTIPDTPHPFWLFHPWFKPTLDISTSFLDKMLKNKRPLVKKQAVK